MSDVAELKGSIDGLGKAFEAFKAAHAVEIESLKAGKGIGEVTEKLAKIEADLLKQDEAKQRLERAFLAASNVEKAAPEAKAGEYKSALNVALKSGKPSDFAKVEAVRAEIKAMSSLSGPEGGFWLTMPEIDPTVRYDVVETSPMRSLATVQTISGPSMKGKRRTGRATTGGWVGEQSTRIETSTPTLGEWEIFAREMYAEPHAPQSFLDDAAVDIEAWLSGEIAFEYSILENTAFWAGTGANTQPRGLNTYPDTDPGNGAFIEAVDIITSNALAGNDFIALQEALKEPYQRNASWAFKRSTLSLIRKATTITGATTTNYIWQPGLTVGAPSVILGKPYSFHADLPAVAAENDTYPIFYGDFREAYRILDRQGISVIRDAITSKGFVKFYSVKRVGADVVNFEAMKRLENKS